MSHMHRFYEPSLEAESGAELLLTEEEAHHALSVVRLRDGEEVALFDGRGTEAVGTLFRQGKRNARVVIGRVRREDPPNSAVVLAPAWLHRDRPMEEIIRRGTELGVTRFAFWRAMRSQRPVANQDKWSRLAVESCKQCGRLYLPRFDFFDDLSAALTSFSGCILLADALAAPSDLLLPPGALTSCALVVGPEGDFADGERDALREHGALPLSLGRQILRTEVASIALATVVLNTLGTLGSRLTPPRETTV
jgi:16S rRNA (uracil1498-N3)-methyltransferase